MGVATPVTVGASIFLVFCSYQPSELPLMVLFSILAGDAIIHAYGSSGNSDGTLRSTLLAMSTILVSITLGAASLSLLWGDVAKLVTTANRDFPKFETDRLRPFVPVGADLDYTRFVNDGITLLKEKRLPGERVMSLDFTNPFSYGLGIPPAPGGTTNLQFGGSFDNAHRVEAEKLFGHSQLVMVPHLFSDWTLQKSIPRIYGPYLRSRYQEVAESREWVLYRRRF